MGLLRDTGNSTQRDSLQLKKKIVRINRAYFLPTTKNFYKCLALMKMRHWVVCSTPHALSPDALIPDDLSPHALSPHALSADGLTKNKSYNEKIWH